jgi:hypothetical protein
MALQDENQLKTGSSSSGMSSHINAASTPAQANDGGRSETVGQSKPSRLKSIWTSLDLDVFTILLMAKGGIPPALALGLLQITVVANHFSTIGYLGKPALDDSIKPSINHVQLQLYRSLA